MAIFYSSPFIAGYENWLSIGILSGLLLILPYVGFVISMLISLLAGFWTLWVFQGSIATILVFLLVQFIEGVFPFKTKTCR
ncbi:MAG: hypothetical protein CM15mP58_03970 [Burkholderiaceae bacterium]|nr:MAG: hypothetical protein CM15mP58_03970 [Burkholderiaceae bacterium]